MKTLMITAAAMAFATPIFAQDATTPPATETMPAETMPAETAPVEAMPADAMVTAEIDDVQTELSATNQGVTASWRRAARSIPPTSPPAPLGPT